MSGRSVDRWIGMSGFVVVIAVLSVACRAGGAARDPAYARGPALVMAVPGLDAVKPDNWDLDFLTFLPLAKRDAHGELRGQLAESWHHSPDHREYTFRLRTGLQWHDGTPVTAHDVKFTLELLGHPEIAEYGGLEAVVLDDATVRIRGRDPGYIDDVTYFPRHLLQRLEPKRFREWKFWTRPVGNGPYRFVRYEPDTMMEFEADPNYFAGKPEIERVTLKFVGDAGLTELLAGNVDVTAGTLAQIPRIAADPRFRVYSRATNGARAIYWKTDHPLFSDARVRRALTHALDRHELLRLLNLSTDLPIADGIFTRRQLQRREWSAPLRYDPEQAKALLEAAGWIDRDGDGVREKDATRFHFTGTVWQGEGLPQLATYVQQFLRQVGVRMDIAYVEPTVMWQRLKAGDFEAWFGVGQPHPASQLRDFGRGNRSGYRSAAAFEIIDRLVANANPAEEDRLYKLLSDIYVTDMPFTRLLPWSRDWFVHRRVRGLRVPLLIDPDTAMERLWMEDDGERHAP